jgi:L-2-hydroxyglutarate oxidase LhgO
LAEQVDTVVIGAGVVGLAVAAALAERGRDVIVLERALAIGTETSSRNSEVIHAGIYYPTGSVRAGLCVRGKRLLYAFCAQHQVPHARIGKVIVATEPGQMETLDGYRAQAAANGAGDLEWLSRERVAALEPAVRAVGGLWSASTGIVDSHAYMLALQGRLQAAGGSVAFGAAVTAGEVVSGGTRLRVDSGGEDVALEAAAVVNAAGLQAPAVARSIAGVPDARIPPAWFARGHYYAYSGRSPFRHLVYPVAEAGGLGVHVTLDLAGACRFGPDVKWIDAPDYAFDDSRREHFVAAIRRYFPGLEPARLHPGYTGIRPKISGPGEAAADFVIDGPEGHGIAGMVNLFGIESPGLTASLAIAERVAALVTG